MVTLARPLPHAAEPLPGDVRLLQATGQALWLLALLALAAVLAAWALKQPVWSLRGIRIEGEVSRNSVASLRAAATTRLQGNFLTLSLGEAREAFESVPWVRRAVVRRVWPMHLVVQLEEHQPAALWGADDESERMVNSHGEVFEASLNDVEDDDLPRLVGPDGSAPQMLAMLQRLKPVLDGLGDGELQTLTLSPRGSWRVLLDDGATLELGRGTEDEVVARSQRFVQTMPRVTAAYQRPLQSADLRHVGGFAVRLKGITTTAAEPPRTRPAPPPRPKPSPPAKPGSKPGSPPAATRH